MSTTYIISDKYGNMKKVSNVRDGINLTSIQNRKNISDRPNNINSALGIADNRSKILNVPYPIIKVDKKPIVDKVEKKENKIETKKPIVDKVEKKENKIETKKPIVDKVEKKENKIEENEPIVDKVEKKENKIEENEPIVDKVEKKENKIEENEP